MKDLWIFFYDVYQMLSKISFRKFQKFLKRGGVSLISILTNPFQCYLSECLVCVFCLLAPFPSVLFVFHGKTYSY